MGEEIRMAKTHKNLSSTLHGKSKGNAGELLSRRAPTSDAWGSVMSDAGQLYNNSIRPTFNKRTRRNDRSLLQPELDTFLRRRNQLTTDNPMNANIDSFDALSSQPVETIAPVSSNAMPTFDTNHEPISIENNSPTISDLYSMLNQPVEQFMSHDDDEHGQTVDQSSSDRPSDDTVASAPIDVQLPDVGTWVPKAPRDREHDWIAAVNSASNTVDDIRHGIGDLARSIENADQWDAPTGLFPDAPERQATMQDAAGVSHGQLGMTDTLVDLINRTDWEDDAVDALVRAIEGAAPSAPSPDLFPGAPGRQDTMADAARVTEGHGSFVPTETLRDLIDSVDWEDDAVANYMERLRNSVGQDDVERPDAVADRMVDAMPVYNEHGKSDIVQPLVDAMARQWDYAHEEKKTPDQEMPMWVGTAGDVEMPTAGATDTMQDAWRVSGDLTDALRDKEQRDTFGGATLADVGDTDVNEDYVQFAVEHGASQDDMDEIMARGGLLDQVSDNLYVDSGFNPRFYGKISPDDEYVDTQAENKYTTGDIEVMDDGSAYDYDHMTSRWMTGTQYIKYREEMGIDGRPIEEIDPRAVYDKAAEAAEYGFVPFLPDEMSWYALQTTHAATLPGRIAGEVGNLREHITGDYVINLGDQSFSGREFDRKATPYIQQINYYMETDPERYQYVYELPVREADGTTSYHYGYPIDATWVDGQFVISFEDGSTATLSGDLTDDEIMEALGETPQMVRPEEAHGDLPEDLSDLVYSDDDRWMTYVFPDLVLSDGTSIPYYDVWRLYRDQTPGNDEDVEFVDDDISYEFSDRPVPIWFDNKPGRFSAQEMFYQDENGNLHFDPSDIGNNAIDFTAGSLPISLSAKRFGLPFLLWDPWIYSVSSALASAAGVDPASYDPRTGSYLPIAAYYDDDGNLRYGVQEAYTDDNGDVSLRVNNELSDSTRLWNALGTAAVPFTEEIAGSVGGSDFLGNLLGVSDEAMERIASPTLRQLITRRLYGPIGEGLEEVAGNWFDEATNYGPSRMWADPVLDEDDEPVYDIVGHEIRNGDTSLVNKAVNAYNPADIGNALAGGILVSEVMGLPGIFDRFGEYGTAIRNQERMREMGINPYVMPKETARREVPREYLDQFSKEPITWRSGVNVVEG